MAGDTDEFPTGALSDIAYLSRSDSRVRILEAIATEPYARSALEDKTGIARTTIGRIISEFEERQWARRTSNGEYTATPPGERIIAEFEPFLQSIQVIRDLDDLVAWLPTDVVEIDLHHFSDATIHRPDPADPMSTVAEFNTRLEGVSEFQCLVGIAPPVPFEQEMRDAVVNRGIETKHVITDEEFDYLHEHPDRIERWHEYLEGGANVYRYNGGIPCNLFVFDNTILISHTNSEYGEPHTAIETANKAVLSWAKEVIESYRAKAEPLDSNAFSVGQT